MTLISISMCQSSALALLPFPQITVSCIMHLYSQIIRSPNGWMPLTSHENSSPSLQTIGYGTYNLCEHHGRNGCDSCAGSRRSIYLPGTPIPGYCFSRLHFVPLVPSQAAYNSVQYLVHAVATHQPIAASHHSMHESSVGGLARAYLASWDCEKSNGNLCFYT
jgi:hypothetical protein